MMKQINRNTQKKPIKMATKYGSMMEIMRLIILIFFISFTHSLFSQNLGCGTPDPTPLQQQAMDQLIQEQHQRQFDVGYAMSESQEFAIVAHIIRRDDGTGGLTEQQLRNALDGANTYFSNANLSFFYLDIRYIDDSRHYDFTYLNEPELRDQYNFANTINIYFANSVLSSSGSLVGGYAYFPNLSNPESSINVILMSNRSTTNGTTLAHELGHFFYLYHTHGTSNTRLTDELVIRPGEASMGCVAPDCTPLPANCATNGDRLCDTEADPNLSGLVIVSCEYTGNATDANNDVFRPNTRNIMSYTRSSCRNLFTAGQYERMNMTSTTTRNYLHKSRVFANFEADRQIDCDELSVTYNSNLSINEERYSWSFEGGIPAVSTEANPTVQYLNNGNYDVTLTVSDNMGNEDTRTYTDYIAVIDATPPNTISVAGSFEEDILSETIIDNGLKGYFNTWNVTQHSKSEGNKSMLLPLYNSNENEEDLLILKPFNTTVDTSFVLTFDYAFNAGHSDRQDTLKIFMKDPCSRVTYLLSTLSGIELATAPNKDSSVFRPTVNQWASDTIIFPKMDVNDFGEIFFTMTRYNEGATSIFGDYLYIDNYRIAPHNTSYIDLTSSNAFNPYYVPLGTDSTILYASITNESPESTAPATNIHFYRSTDAIIDATDTEIGMRQVSTLEANEVSSHTLKFDVPTTAGEYYYGVCIDPVMNEALTTNNCSNSPFLVYTPLADSQRTSFSRDTLVAAENSYLKGIWSNGITMWVLDNGDDKIYAYDLATKTRDSVKDFTYIALNPRDIWSDGITMWVVDSGDDKIYAYNMASKQRDETKDFNTLYAAGNTTPFGLWSDGKTMWVSDINDYKVYAYDVKNKSLNEEQSFDVDISFRISGLWSNGETMWVHDQRNTLLAAYDLATKQRKESLDFPSQPSTATARFTYPYSLWSDGKTMWVSDSYDTIVHAYDFIIPQTLSFNLPQTNYFIGDSTELTATASSGLPVTLSSNNQTVATITGNKINFVGEGMATITASQDGGSMHVPVADSMEIIVSKRQQTLNFNLSETTYFIGDSTELTATASSGLPVTLSSTNQTVATITGNKINFVGLGMATITASQDGGSMHVPVADSMEIIVSKRQQTLNFNLSETTYFIGDSTELTATSSSGLRVTLSSNNQTVATITGNKINFVGEGMATITASQDGGSMHVPVADSMEIIVSKRQQTLNFNLSETTYFIGDSTELTATASSGLPVTLSSTNQTVATITGNKINFVGEGMATITASQDGGSMHVPVADSMEIIVSKRQQTLNFNLSETTYFIGDSTELTATASSGLPVTLSSNNQTVATITGNKINFVGLGMATITASQDGRSMHVPVADSMEIIVSKRQQTLNFNLSETTYFIGDSTELTATASSGLPVTLSSTNQTVATITGNKINFVGEGMATITASQDGGNMHVPVADSMEIIVSKRQQTLNFNLSETTYFIGDSTELTATASSGLPVTLSSNNQTVATITGNKINFVGQGTATITATQDGNDTYTVAITSVDITVSNTVLKVISEKNLTIYPNPSEGMFQLSKRADVVRVYDMSGRLIYRGRKVEQLNLTSSPAGNYLVEVRVGKESGKYTVIRE